MIMDESGSNVKNTDFTELAMQKQSIPTNFIAVFALLFGALSTVAIHAQDDTEARKEEDDAAKYLTEAAKKSFLSSSYRVESEATIKQEFKAMNRTQEQSSKTTTRYEKPFLNSEVDSEVEMGPMGKKKVHVTVIGKMNRDADKYKAYMKSDQGGGGWKNMADESPVNLDRMFRRFKDPEKISERLKDVKFGDDEDVNGHTCRKITASMKEDKFENSVKDIMKGRMKKMVEDVEITLKSSKVTYWIRKDSRKVEKIDIQTEQEIDVTMKMGRQKKTITMNQDQSRTITFSDYGNTTVPEKYIKKFRELEKEKKDSAGEDSSEEDGKAEEGDSDKQEKENNGEEEEDEDDEEETGEEGDEEDDGDDEDDGGKKESW